MTKKNVVSSKTHTKQQLNDYANQHNSNNKAYQARIANDKNTKNTSKKHKAVREAKKYAKLEEKCGVLYPLDWMCYGNPYDFE